MSIVVLCPMEIERKAVASALRKAGLCEVEGVRVIRTGIGKEAVIRALAGVTPGLAGGSLIVLAGACGGLTHTDDAPRIVGVIDEHGGRWTPALVRQSDSGGVLLVAVDRIVATPADKRELAQRTGAAIVDMESHAFAAECDRRGMAWTVVRGVSDTPDELLSPEVLGWLRPDGRTRAVRAAIDLARRPSLIPHIMGVMRRAHRVLPLVGERVVEIARAWLFRASESPENSAAGGPHRRAPIEPLAIPPGTPVLLIVGGTFDPPHLAHTDLPCRVRAHIEGASGWHDRAWLAFVPAARSPHKASRPLASDEDRLEMLALALRDVPRSLIWRDELCRAAAGGATGEGEPSYMVDTLERARARLDANGGGGTVVRLVIGADQAAEFHRWREARRIVELAEPLVMAREVAGAGSAPVSGTTDAGAIVESMQRSGFWTPAELDGWRRRVVPVGRIDASATQVRRAVAAGRLAEVQGLLAPAVLTFIRERGLYAEVWVAPSALPKAI